MPLTLSVLDETTKGERRSAGTFQFENATVTLREMIRLRVQQEVARFNEGEFDVFQGLVRPEEPERLLNGVRPRRLLIWEEQFEKAIRTFNGNGYVVLVDDSQVTDLDQTIELTPQSVVTFLKLVPLKGG